MRRILVTCLGMWCTDDMVDAARMCVSELLGNVLRHCGPEPWVTIAARPTQSGVRIEVFDAEFRIPAGAADASDLDEDGRGLLLIAAYADRFGYEPAIGGKYAWVEIDHPAP